MTSKMDELPLHKEIDVKKQQNVKHPCDGEIWRFCHYTGYVFGAFAFLIGSILYYPIINFVSGGNDGGVAKFSVTAAWMYTIGSAGFVFVDGQEFFTFYDDVELRVNVLCSVIGSTLYLIGSIGFFPDIYISKPLIGILGFLIGSVFNGFSQLWKLVRVLSCPDDAGVTLNVARARRLNAVYVEAGGMVGGFSFLIGTAFFWKGPIEGETGCFVTCRSYEFVLAFWVLGSVAFSFAALSLAYRHVILKIT
jgi:hypothetical protein